jgi:hypothetical protein
VDFTTDICCPCSSSAPISLPLLTFLFFPLTVGTAYVADQKIFLGNFLEKKVKGGKLMGADEEHGQQMSVVKSTENG